MDQRRRLPLKKVKLQSSSLQLRDRNLYQLNTSRLTFIPKMFVSFMGVGAFTAAVWYFAPFGHSAKSEPQVAGVREIAQQIQEAPVQTEVNIAGKTPVRPPLSDQFIQVVNPQQAECYLQFQAATPQNLAAQAPKADKTGWWLPTECADTNLQAIQILRLSPEQAKPLSNAVLLDEQDTYAVLYRNTNQATADFPWKTYLKPLTQPIFQDRFYFNTATAFDTRRMKDKTYYLDGNCQNGGAEPCKLWVLNNFNGLVELIKKNIADTGPNDANTLAPGNYLRFAKTQDYPEGLNFVLVNDKTKNYQLIRFNLQSLQTTQSLPFKVGQPGYTDYFR